MTSKPKLLTIISDFLKSHTQFVMATNGEFPWIATMYYAVDTDLNLYFLTSPTTIHATQLQTNPNVAATVADSPQLLNSKKSGLQISGICQQLTEPKAVTEAINLWSKTLGITSSDYTYEGMEKNAISGRMYKLTPKKMKFFNEALWEEGKEELVEL